MADKLDVKKAGLTLGIVYMLYHFSWAVLVALGGSGFVNWIAGMHFLSVSYAAAPLDVVTLLIGLVLAFVTGAVTGAFFAYIYNWMK